MNKKLLSMILFVVGCGPMDIYNAKVDRINNYWSSLESQSSLSSNQRLIAYWEKMKEEFPDHFYIASRCLDLVKNEANADNCEENFWKVVRQDVQARQAQFSQGLMGMSNMYNTQMNQQQQYYNNLNQQNRSSNCNTFLYGNYANTSCY